jgi:hypothetical protein
MTLFIKALECRHAMLRIIHDDADWLDNVNVEVYIGDIKGVHCVSTKLGTKKVGD